MNNVIDHPTKSIVADWELQAQVLLSDKLNELSDEDVACLLVCDKDHLRKQGLDIPYIVKHYIHPDYEPLITEEVARDVLKVACTKAALMRPGVRQIARQMVEEA